MTTDHMTVTGTRPHHTFTRKAISVTFDVVNQDGSTGSLTLKEGHRIRATIDNTGMGTGATLALTIEGMTPEDMARLSHIGNITNADHPVLRDQSLTSVTVKAGTYGKVLPVVFFGLLTESFASFNGGSSVFTVRAFTIGDLVTNKLTARSYRGGKMVIDLLDDICRDNGITLVNHGGWGQYSVLNNHYAEGSALDQIENIMHACQGTFHYIPLVRTHEEKARKVISTGELHIWGPTYRETEEATDHNTPLISATTGLIGYPEYNLYGLKFSCLFRSDINFFVPIKIQSDRMPAGWEVVTKTPKNQDGQIIQNPSLPYEGLWLPFWVSHDISSEVPNGPWSTNVECQRSNTSQPLAYRR